MTSSFINDLLVRVSDRYSGRCSLHDEHPPRYFLCSRSVSMLGGGSLPGSA